ncbi:hypothetical protein BGY98DRAFT_1099566 [Russula aff. rugulosa BPL654]|nr:hypothetical protein BGY98DRAFT_1099566 [Russula aff. rugulosa BPL654]
MTLASPSPIPYHGASVAGCSAAGPYSPSIDSLNEEHATILATKWYDHKKLAELGETEGLVYKKGPFSISEEQNIRDAIEEYRVKHALTEDNIQKLMFTKHKGSTFWQDVARSVPMRPIKNVFVHVRRAWERTASNQGRWSEHEDEGLEQAVRELGHSWDTISKRLGRSPANCRDRYRNHLAHRGERRRGAWSPEEVQELTAIVRSMMSRQGGSSRGYPGQTSHRGWDTSGTASNAVTNGSSRYTVAMSTPDRIGLPWTLISSCTNESEIVWSKFPDPGWNRWSAYQLRRKWQALKRSVYGHENLTPREIAHAVLRQQQEKQQVCDVTIP